MKKKTKKSIDSSVTAKLINCNDECPPGYIKVKVYDPRTGDLIGCKCVREQ